MQIDVIYFIEDIMRIIRNAEFGGERPLYAEKDLRLENVVINPGESALKETARIEAVGCEFKGKYPFWCTDGFTVEQCILRYTILQHLR